MFSSNPNNRQNENLSAIIDDYSFRLSQPTSIPPAALFANHSGATFNYGSPQTPIPGTPIQNSQAGTLENANKSTLRYSPPVPAIQPGYLHPGTSVTAPPMASPAQLPMHDQLYNWPPSNPSMASSFPSSPHQTQILSQGAGQHGQACETGDGATSLQGHGKLPIRGNPVKKPRKNVANSGRKVVRTGRRGAELCDRCRRLRQGIRAPCVFDDPSKPCEPCKKAGVAAQCGPKTFPGGRISERSRQIAKQARIDSWHSWLAHRGSKAVVDYTFRLPKHGLDLQAALSNPHVAMDAIQPVSNLKTALGVQKNELFVNTTRGSKSSHHNEQCNFHDGSSKRSLPTLTQVANMAAEIEEIVLGYFPNTDDSTISSIVKRTINDLHGRQTPGSDSNSYVASSSAFMSEQGESLPLASSECSIGETAEENSRSELVHDSAQSPATPREDTSDVFSLYSFLGSPFNEGIVDDFETDENGE